jgi:hypothetical protein
MHVGWQPKFRVGDRVHILSCHLLGTVVEIDPHQNAYVIEINGNPQFRLLCTANDLRPFPGK